MHPRDYGFKDYGAVQHITFQSLPSQIEEIGKKLGQVYMVVMETPDVQQNVGPEVRRYWH